MAHRLRSAIVGLGQVGMLFDRDAKRRGVWTHFTAYEKLSSQYELVAVCEPDSAKRAIAARRRPSLGVYSSIDSLLQQESIDVISLCTPPALHAQQIMQVAGRVQGIICEKPLSTHAAEAQKAVRVCQQRKTLLAVNYYKRYEAHFKHLHQCVRSGHLGPVRLWRGLYAGPWEAVGSHLVDLIRWLGGEWSVRSAWAAGPKTEAWHADLRAKNAEAEIRWTGPREKLIFEVEAFGDRGRARVYDNGSGFESARFKRSPRYSGYEELAGEKPAKIKPVERFLPLFREMALSILRRRSVLTSDGESALKTQQLMDAIQCR